MLWYVNALYVILKLSYKSITINRGDKMPSENDVFETRNKRCQVLNTIYDLAKQGKLIISNSDITSYTDIQGKELYDILKNLIDEGLIREMSSIKGLFSMGGYAAVSITNSGLIYVENTSKKSNE